MRLAFILSVDDTHSQKWIDFLSEKHYIVIITTVNTSYNSIHYSENIKVYNILPQVYSYSQYKEKANTIRQLKQLLEFEKIDILHSIYAWPYSIWANHTKFKNHIVTTYGSDILIDYKQKNFFTKSPIKYLILKTLKFELRKALKNAKYITSTSVNQQNVIKHFINDENKLSIIRTGVNCNSFLEIYNELKKNNNETTIFSCRAMQPLYNIDTIVDGFILLKKKVPHIPLKLVLANYCNSESYLKKITKKINENNLNDFVEIRSNMSFKELIQEYKNADVVIMVPKSDGSPVTGMETLLAKKPLIMGSVSYDSDLYNENTVWRLKDVTAENICNQIIEIINLPESKKQERISNGFEFVMKNGNLELEILKLESLYNNMLK